VLVGSFRVGLLPTLPGWKELMTAFIPANEAERLAAVRRYDILDTPPDGAFDRVTRIAARLFDVPISIVSVVDSDRIWFKSHHGLDAKEIPRSPGLCASAILDSKPWVITDASVDPRSLTNPLVAGEFGLRFYAGAPLRTQDGFNLGTLCVIDHAPRPISQTDIEQLTDLAAIVMDELELRRAAKRELSKKEALFKEVHHRVKNNFQIVSSLLSIQSRSVPQEMRKHFEESLQRVQSMGLLHEKFYAGEHVETINITDYVQELVASIIGAFGLGERIRGQVQGPRIEIDLDRGTPLALLLGEVVANACKHAFPDQRAGTIKVEITTADGRMTVRVADDGVGPQAAKPSSGTRMGTRLIANFVQQLNGSSWFGPGERAGSVFELSMPTPPTA
jgi:two-component sensor histidine kinase